MFIGRSHGAIDVSHRQLGGSSPLTPRTSRGVQLLEKWGPSLDQRALDALMVVGPRIAADVLSELDEKAAGLVEPSVYIKRACDHRRMAAPILDMSPAGSYSVQGFANGGKPWQGLQNGHAERGTETQRPVAAVTDVPSGRVLLPETTAQSVASTCVSSTCPARAVEEPHAAEPLHRARSPARFTAAPPPLLSRLNEGQTAERELLSELGKAGVLSEDGQHGMDVPLAAHRAHHVLLEIGDDRSDCSLHLPPQRQSTAVNGFAGKDAASDRGDALADLESISLVCDGNMLNADAFGADALHRESGHGDKKQMHVGHLGASLRTGNLSRSASPLGGRLPIPSDILEHALPPRSRSPLLGALPTAAALPGLTQDDSFWRPQMQSGGSCGSGFSVPSRAEYRCDSPTTWKTSEALAQAARNVLAKEEEVDLEREVCALRRLRKDVKGGLAAAHWELGGEKFRFGPSPSLPSGQGSPREIYSCAEVWETPTTVTVDHHRLERIEDLEHENAMLRAELLKQRERSEAEIAACKLEMRSPSKGERLQVRTCLQAASMTSRSTSPAPVGGALDVEGAGQGGQNLTLECGRLVIEVVGLQREIDYLEGELAASQEKAKVALSTVDEQKAELRSTTEEATALIGQQDVLRAELRASHEEADALRRRQAELRARESYMDSPVGKAVKVMLQNDQQHELQLVMHEWARVAYQSHSCQRMQQLQEEADDAHARAIEAQEAAAAARAAAEAETAAKFAEMRLEDVQQRDEALGRSKARSASVNAAMVFLGADERRFHSMIFKAWSYEVYCERRLREMSASMDVKRSELLSQTAQTVEDMHCTLLGAQPGDTSRDLVAELQAKEAKLREQEMNAKRLEEELAHREHTAMNYTDRFSEEMNENRDKARRLAAQLAEREEHSAILAAQLAAKEDLLEQHLESQEGNDSLLQELHSHASAARASEQAMQETQEMLERAHSEMADMGLAQDSAASYAEQLAEQLQHQESEAEIHRHMSSHYESQSADLQASAEDRALLADQLQQQLAEKHAQLETALEQARLSRLAAERHRKSGWLCCRRARASSPAGRPQTGGGPPGPRPQAGGGPPPARTQPARPPQAGGGRQPAPRGGGFDPNMAGSGRADRREHPERSAV
eukprot:TRINITY_DN20186_c0_g1_i2.p1 TRINITY_DN20186_c0_g1~~TRINITY_DN20186_c0_g1_i2.p1  ORF type:complete len:1136 (-),score=257.42 TRINITY_DN20186_c0_g1_i2:369-3776(-)